MDYLFALQNIREASPEFFTYIFLFISEFIMPAFLLAGGIYYWSINKEEGSYILMSYSFGYTINQTIKNIACINRPWVLDSRLHVESHAAGGATGYSFPSGHTVTAASVGGGIANVQRKKTGIVILMMVLILMVAFSRNWLGAHTMKDVVTAMCVAALAIILANVLRYFISRKPELDTVVCAVAISINIIILLLLSLKKYETVYNSDGSLLVDPYKMLSDCYTSLGTAVGFFTGWWLERHFIKFSMDVDKKTKIIRGVIGAIIGLSIQFVIGPMFKFAGDHWYHFIKYFLLFFVVMYLYPLCYTKFENRKRA